MIYCSKVFLLNRTQNVRLPADLRFSDDIKVVTVRVKGKERIISPAQHSWDSFFMDESSVTDDFLNNRPEQMHTERESFDD